MKAERESVNEIVKDWDKLKECDLLFQDVTKRYHMNLSVKCISFKIMS